MQDNINILDELKETGAAALLNVSRDNLYALPADYFNNLALDTLAQIFVKSIPAVHLFTVPQGYFENLPELILEKIFINQDISIYTKANYSLPAGYFDNLAANVLNKIKASATSDVQRELAEISPLLAGLPKTNVYSAPDNFFAEIQPVSIVTETIAKPQAKVISLGSRIGKWTKLAAAACIAAFLFGAGYLYFSPDKAMSGGTSASISTVDVQKEMASLSDEEITNYLKDDVNMAVYTEDDSEDQQQNFDLQNLLNNVSDQEIQDYLSNDANGTGNGGGI